MPNSIPDEVQQDLERMGRLMVETFDFAIESGFLTNLFTEARRRLVEGMPACDTAGSTDTVPGGNTQAGLDGSTTQAGAAVEAGATTSAPPAHGERDIDRLEREVRENLRRARASQAEILHGGPSRRGRGGRHRGRRG
ncbi:hypothetical protein CLAIMM_05699 [Cladophialophora immunda]|nr:hypothetical protein CLAIMM_05699 [Cladophialophora immunda]